VNLREKHPEAFSAAMKYEKSALEHGSPFTWSMGEPLTELEKPGRMTQIKLDYEKRKQREAANKPKNPLRSQVEDTTNIDSLFLEDEGGGACAICHK
jgi:hypothetical protein